MTEWLKNICLKPLNYGLDKVNFLVMQVVKMILNMYGKKLLKIKDDRIIEKTECIDHRNKFYLYPLDLRPIEQDLGPNLLKIDYGLISGLTISIPWTSVLTDSTVINIDNISLECKLCQNDNSVYFSTADMANSYFLRAIEEDDNLVNVYKNVYQLLLKYFHKININVESINIVLENFFRIVITDLLFADHHLTISKVEIHSLSNTKNNILLATIEQLDCVNNGLSVNNLNIDLELANHFPEYYLDSGESSLELELTINNLYFDRLSAKNVIIIINKDQISVNGCDKIMIEKSTKIVSDNNIHNLMVCNSNDKTIYLNKSIAVKIWNIPELKLWFNELSEFINVVRQKIILLDSQISLSVVNNNWKINNLQSNVIIMEHQLKLKLDQISLEDITQLSLLELQYDEIHYSAGLVTIENQNLFRVNNLKVDNRIFSLSSEELTIISQPNLLKLGFNKARADNIISIVQYIIAKIG
jgi:hypothetical protein